MNSLSSKTHQGRKSGFTLVEMLVAVSILALIMILAAQMIGATSKIWKNTTSKIEAFQNARDGFQLMTDELRQATTNTYWDYFDNTGLPANYSTLSPFQPSAYGRQSDLHFKSGQGVVTTGEEPNTQGVFFQAPLGYVAAPATYGSLQNLLNSVGFFVQVSDGTNVINVPPPFLPTTTTWRYRLMQFIQPSEQNTIFKYNLTKTTIPTAWFNTPLNLTTGRPVRIVANNIIGLIIWPKSSDSATDTLSTNYGYDSRLNLASGDAPTDASKHPKPFAWPKVGTALGQQPLQMNQMPPILRVAMIAIDEPSAKVIPVTNDSSNNISGTLFDDLNTAFQESGTPLFSTPQNMDADLLALQYAPTTGLASIVPHVNFRVFSTTIVVKSARFSTQ